MRVSHSVFLFWRFTINQLQSMLTYHSNHFYFDGKSPYRFAISTQLKQSELTL